MKPDAIGAIVVDSYVNPKGAFVSTVTPGGPAAAAKIVPSDVITAVDGHAIASGQALDAYLSKHRTGDLVMLHIVHYGNVPASDVKLVLGETPPPLPGQADSVQDQRAANAPTNTPPRGVQTAANQPAPRAQRGAPQGPQRPDIIWTRFTDPVEHAFTIDVPQGWRVTGGTRRMNAVDIRLGVNVLSPDGTVALFYGDPDIPIFTVPSRLTAMAGLRQGMTYNPGQGVQMLIMPYMNGEAFAAQWGARFIAKSCVGGSRTSAKPRPDLSRAMDGFYAQGGIRTSIQAGEVGFSCSVQGMPATAYAFAATEFVQSQMSALWDVKTFVGFTAPNARAAGAYGLLTHMVGSFAIDRDWQARQNNLAQQFDRIVAQTNEAVSHAIIENGKALAARSDAIIQNGKTQESISDMIVKGGEARSNATSNAIDKYDEYAVRGTSDFVGSSGTVYGNLDNSYAHTYVNDAHEIRQTDSENAPGPGWQEIRPQQNGQ